MRIIGVIDLRAGQAVHAQGGCRHAYRPVDHVAGVGVHGSAARLASAYINQLSIRELYVADLDAIGGGAEQDAEVRAVADCGVPVWLDAGVTTVGQAQRAMARGASRVIVGLETLTSFAQLSRIAAAVQGERVAFSLDLRESRPIAADQDLRDESAATIARRARDAGTSAVIVLDLARIGATRGLDLPLIENVREAVPEVLLLAGGGVRDAADLRRLADAGCDGALVATVLHGPGGAELVRVATTAVGHQGYVTR